MQTAIYWLSHAIWGFNFFITFESYCTVKSAKVKLKEKQKTAFILGDAKKQFVYFYFQEGFRMRFVGVLSYYLSAMIHVFPSQGLDFDTAKKVRFACKPWIFLTF